MVAEEEEEEIVVVVVVGARGEEVAEGGWACDERDGEDIV